MLKNLTGSETDTFDEVNKELNRIIDNLNLVEAKILSQDSNIVANAKAIKANAKAKKGDK